MNRFRSLLQKSKYSRLVGRRSRDGYAVIDLELFLIIWLFAGWHGENVRLGRLSLPQLRDEAPSHQDSPSRTDPLETIQF